MTRGSSLPKERYLIGRLYFFVGSSIAVAEQDHAAAVKYYVQSRKYLSASPPTSAALDLGRHGERFVSMGASYFESGDRELGVRLTREGLEIMQEAATAALTKESALALPVLESCGHVQAAGQIAGIPRIRRDGVANRLGAGRSPAPLASWKDHLIASFQDSALELQSCNVRSEKCKLQSVSENATDRPFHFALFTLHSQFCIRRPASLLSSNGVVAVEVHC